MRIQNLKPKTPIEQIAYNIVKRKQDQGCKFIVKDEVFANDLANEIVMVILNERKRCLEILSEEGYLGLSYQRIEKGE